MIIEGQDTRVGFPPIALHTLLLNSLSILVA